MSEKQVHHKDTKKTKKKHIIKHQSTEKSIKKNGGKKEKKVIIVHGWDGDITKGWFPWLRQTLESQGFKVIMEQMPEPDKPQIDVWTQALKNISGDVDEQTYFVGHSVGCQTIIRMLEKPEAKKAGGAIFLAGWFDLKEQTFKEDPKSETTTRQIAEPWINIAIDFFVVQSRFNPGTVTAIFSDNDPYVDITNADIFKQKLGARIFVENNKGHYRHEDDITTIPLLVEELLRISNETQEKKD